MQIGVRIPLMPFGKAVPFLRTIAGGTGKLNRFRRSELVDPFHLHRDGRVSVSSVYPVYRLRSLPRGLARRECRRLREIL